MRVWGLAASRRLAIAASSLQRPRTFVSRSQVLQISSDENHSSDVESHVRPSGQLVCGNCSSVVSQTNDLVFFKRKNGVHLSSISGAPLEQLYTGPVLQNDYEDNALKLKKGLHCLQCNQQVGSLGELFSVERLFFSAKRVEIHLPEDASPLMSVSGYPSSVLNFSTWNELFLMQASQPSLRETLGILDIRNTHKFSHSNKDLNTQILKASSRHAVLEIVDKHAHEMNAVNIQTALHRVGHFSSYKFQKKAFSDSTAWPHSTSTMSEAPEDGLADFPPLDSTAQTERDQMLMWKLIDMTENLVNFNVMTLQNLNAINAIATALHTLRVGQMSTLKPLAAQTCYLVNGKREASNLSSSAIESTVNHIISLTPRAEYESDWIRHLLDTCARYVLQEEPVNVVAVTSLVQSFIMAEHFDQNLFTRAFQLANDGAVDDIKSSESVKMKVKSQLWQAHIDCEAHKRPSHLRLSERMATECQEEMKLFNVRAKRGLSFTRRHLLTSALDRVYGRKTWYEMPYVVEGSYSVIAALPKHRIAIELYGDECYKVEREDAVHSAESAQDSGTKGKGRGRQVEHEQGEMLGTVALQARQIEQLGWALIRVRVASLKAIPNIQGRTEYISMLMEMARL